MSEWTKRDQARVDFLNAAVAHQRALDADVDDVEAWKKTKDAWGIYRELIDGQAENGELSKERWYCPHCGAERPAWEFQLVGLVSMGIGAIQYLNVICGNDACRKLIAVMGVGYLPEEAAIAAAKAQMKGKLHTA